MRREEIVAPNAVLASNTSSISVTALANGMRLPERVVGMHFFNPVPQMKLVEVVTGLKTSSDVGQQVHALAQAWGKVPVRARSTPGFIVNRIARPFYAEALALLQEQAASANVIDHCLRGFGFRMGPCELMDLIGHDTNFAVTQSVYDANFQDKRYVPSLVQRELVDGGLLGRKSGSGFYTYPAGLPALPQFVAEAPRAAYFRTHGRGRLVESLHTAASGALGEPVEGASCTGWAGLEIGETGCLVVSDGDTADVVAARLGRREVAVIDRFDPDLLHQGGLPLAVAFALDCGEEWRREALACLHRLGFHPIEVADTPGLVVARTVAMLINEASDAVQQGVCTPEDADAAMRLGVNYPVGPFDWLRAWGRDDMLRVLGALNDWYPGERYRTSPRLRSAA